MSDKITIERETLERAVDILDRRLNWNPVVDKLCSEINAALAALPAEAQQESVAIVESKFGDPERFGEREIRVLADLSKIPYGTKLYAAQPAPAAVPLTDEQDRALCEAHYNDASEEYFSARPQMDSAVNRRIFYAGHRKGWLAMLAAAGDKP